MNALKVKAKISCDTCGCTMARSKTIRVVATEKSEAINEADRKVKSWQATLKGQNCAVCASILKSLA